MARETKAQRQERELRESDERWQLLRAEWPNRVLVQLERASKFDFEIKVVKNSDNQFAFSVRNAVVDWVVFHFNAQLSEKQDMTDVYSLEDLENDLNILEQKVAEDEQKQKLKETALSKLSKEEREVLGV